MNPRRRRHYSYRRRYRRNPGGARTILGVNINARSILYAGGGLLLTPWAESQLMRVLPLELSTSTIGKYAIRIAAVLGLSFAAKSIFGADEAKMVAVGGGAYVLSTAVREFMPTLIPGAAPALSAYAAPARGLAAYAAPAPMSLRGYNPVSPSQINPRAVDRYSR